MRITSVCSGARDSVGHQDLTHLIADEVGSGSVLGVVG